MTAASGPQTPQEPLPGLGGPGTPPEPENAPQALPAPSTADGERCRSCGAPILWRKNGRTGRWAPLDAEPDRAGVLVLEGEYRYRYLTAEDEATLAPVRRYTNHFATCPEAGRWRRPSG